MNIHEKLEMARQLERLGVDVIEAGFPIASPEDFESVQKIAHEVQNCQVAALCRAVKGDIDCAWEALKGHPNPLIHIFLATSDIHLESQLNKTCLLYTSIGADAEESLGLSCEKFVKRFAQVEKLARQRDIDMKTAGIQKLDEIWQEIKKSY